MHAVLTVTSDSAEKEREADGSVEMERCRRMPVQT